VIQLLQIAQCQIEIEREDLEMLHDLFMPDDIDAEQDIDSASLNT